MPLLESNDRELTPEVLSFARKLWNYHHMDHILVKSDCILTLGSHDLRVAERAAQLFLEGWAPLLVCSGGLGNLTQAFWTESEADQFASIALRMGVPRDKVLVENKSTNTGENIVFTEKLLAQKGLNPKSFIVVQKPYMERRSFATFKKHWPLKDLVVTSPQIPFDEYPTGDIPLDRVIDIMVGDLQRIREYPSKGFQVHQEIPGDVWNAFERLVELGFDGHLIK